MSEDLSPRGAAPNPVDRVRRDLVVCLRIGGFGLRTSDFRPEGVERLLGATKQLAYRATSSAWSSVLMVFPPEA